MQVRPKHYLNRDLIKISGSERDSNPRPLQCRCSALPTELSKPHENGRIWVSPLYGTFRLCVFRNLGYSSKYVEKIYRTQYEAAMLVYIRCASGTYLGGRVEKTDPRSADYPLTPAPRTTLPISAVEYLSL